MLFALLHWRQLEGSSFQSHLQVLIAVCWNPYLSTDLIWGSNKHEGAFCCFKRAAWSASVSRRNNYLLSSSWLIELRSHSLCNSTSVAPHNQISYFRKVQRLSKRDSSTHFLLQLEYEKRVCNIQFSQHKSSINFHVKKPTQNLSYLY